MRVSHENFISVGNEKSIDSINQTEKRSKFMNWIETSINASKNEFNKTLNKKWSDQELAMTKEKKEDYISLYSSKRKEVLRKYIKTVKQNFKPLAEMKKVQSTRSKESENAFIYKSYYNKCKKNYYNKEMQRKKKKRQRQAIDLDVGKKVDKSWNAKSKNKTHKPYFDTIEYKNTVRSTVHYNAISTPQSSNRVNYSNKKLLVNPLKLYQLNSSLEVKNPPIKEEESGFKDESLVVPEQNEEGQLKNGEDEQGENKTMNQQIKGNVSSRQGTSSGQKIGVNTLSKSKTGLKSMASWGSKTKLWRTKKKLLLKVIK